MEWLLEKVQQDYAYFDQLQKRFEADSAGSNVRHENYGYNSSSSSGYDSGSSSNSSGYGQESSYSAPSNGSSGSSGGSGGGRFSNYY
jgi:hypothetical protein